MALGNTSINRTFWRRLPIQKRPELLLKNHEQKPKNYCNGSRTRNHLVCKRTLNHLAKLVSKTSDIVPVSSKEFLDIQATIECGFTLKRGCDMITAYSKR